MPEPTGMACASSSDMVAQELKIPCAGVSLRGTFQPADGMEAVIIFAHGSGSSRFSPRNQRVAGELHRAGFGTLLFDLLTEEEAADQSRVFDIVLLAERLGQVTRWLRSFAGSRTAIGYFGASTGAAAALEAAAKDPEIFAVVSRGGRPDLSLHIAAVTAPTLLIVGGEDHVVLELNRRALRRLKNGTLQIVPGATHLFEESGKLEDVTELAGGWFSKHLAAKPAVIGQ